MRMQKIKSSNLDKIGYGDGVLEIHFKNGSKYQYTNVPSEVFDDMMKSEFKGKYLNRVVIGTYKYIKLDKDGMSDVSNHNSLTLNNVLDEIDKRVMSGKYDRVSNKAAGIRSRQVCALIDLLIEFGVLK